MSKAARIGLIVLGLVLATSPYPAMSSAAAPVAMPQSLDAVAFDWRDDHGALKRLSDWKGKTILLTMAYSTCREICSYTLHRLQQLQQSADRAGVPIEVVVVSYDPAADGPESWSMYRRHHGLSRSNWHFLTGDEQTTEKFAAVLHFPFWRYDEHVVHGFRILMVQPDGRIATALTWATRGEDLFTEVAHCVSPNTQGCTR